MKDRYTISEMARFFNVSSQTLRYYDKIGLYRPAVVNRENGYRYYSYEQFFTLSLIIQLKKLNFTLDDIQKYIQIKDVGYLEEILKKEQRVIEEEMVELQKLKIKNQMLLKKIQLSRDVEEQETIELRRETERYTYRIPINFEIQNIYQYIKLMYDSYLRELPDAAAAEHREVVLQIRKNNLQQKKFRIYNSIGFFIDQNDIKPGFEIHVIPEGDYVTGYHMGAYDTIHHTYEKLYAYIAEHAYSIVGDSLEFSIISIALTNQKEDFITEIQIPVKIQGDSTQ